MKQQEQNKKGRNWSKTGSKFDTKKSNIKKKELKDYLYYTGSNRQASDFESTTEFIVNSIKGNFSYGKNIAESLWKLEYKKTELWYPTLKTSTPTDAIIKTTETRQFELTYKAKLDATVKHEETFNNNKKTKAYLLVWEHCIRAMQSKLEQKMNFSKTIYNDPIKLLKATKEHALNLQETTYSMEIIDDTIVHFLLMK